jgi:hypothetical protein
VLWSLASLLSYINTLAHSVGLMSVVDESLTVDDTQGAPGLLACCCVHDRACPFNLVGLHSTALSHLPISLSYPVLLSFSPLLLLRLGHHHHHRRRPAVW